MIPLRRAQKIIQQVIFSTIQIELDFYPALAGWLSTGQKSSSIRRDRCNPARSGYSSGFFLQCTTRKFLYKLQLFSVFINFVSPCIKKRLFGFLGFPAGPVRTPKPSLDTYFISHELMVPFEYARFQYAPFGHCMVNVSVINSLLAKKNSLIIFQQTFIQLYTFDIVQFLFRKIYENPRI